MAVSYQLVIDCASPETLARFWAGALHYVVAPIETRRERVEAEAERLVALGATRLRTIAEEGLDHYAVALLDPEGNEFDIN
jgi:hypothetical protein